MSKLSSASTLILGAALALAQAPPAACPSQQSREITVQTIPSEYTAAPNGAEGTFTTGQPAGLTLSAFGFNRSGGPLQFRNNSGIAIDRERLYLADRGNNRILIWNRLPEAGTPPDLVLGQPDFESNLSGAGRRQFNWPIAAAAANGRLVVADTYNDRLLIWNTPPTANADPADLEIKIQWPWGVWTDGRRLVATQTQGGAALVWNSFPTRDGQPPDFQFRAGGQFGTPRSITSDGRSLIVGDHNARVTSRGQGSFVWKSFPETADTPFDFFLTDPIDEAAAWLQGAFLPGGRMALLGRTLHLWPSIPESASQPPTLSVRGFDFQGGDGSGIAAAGERLYVSTANGNRVVVYNAPPRSQDQPPDWALGAPDICANTLSANFIVTNPVPATNGRSLFVSSDFDRKLYVWKRIPNETGARPDLVYSLPEAPWQNAIWQDRLILAGGRTVYVWDGLPLDGRMPAVTLRDAIGGVRLQELRGVAYDGRYLYLSDNGANRVYVWEGIPSPGSPPVAALEIDRPTRLSSDGAHLLVTSTEPKTISVFRVEEIAAGASPRTIGGPGQFNLPEHSLISHGRFFVADTVFNRVHVWSSLDDAIAGKPADALLGSQDRVPSNSQSGLFWPGALAFDGGYLWVGEFKFSGRLLRYGLQPKAPPPPPTFTPEAQALLDKGRAAAPQRYQYAIDNGARFLPTADGRSFYLLWLPPDAARRSRPLIVTLHGSSSWAADEFFLWHREAAAAGYGILALQWWFGLSEGPADYYSPAEMHRQLSAVLEAQGNTEGSALLHGFSRGGANLYGVAALDRKSDERYYAMFLANSGGASADFPPNAAITNGEYGVGVFSGTYWGFFCGGKDPNPDRDGCPAMRRTADWIGRFGGAADLFIEDDDAGHGGFHQTPAHMRAALEAFQANLALRRNAPLAGSVWQVRRDPGFEIPASSIPNAGWVNGEVWLTAGGQQGMRLFRSPDGGNSSTPSALNLTPAFASSGFGPTEVVPRADSNDKPLLYVLGLAPPGANRSAVFRLTQSGDRFSLDPSRPVFEGAPGDAQFLGVPDLAATHDGRLRLIYVARGAAPSNSRTAISTDGGATFQPEFNNPFGDLAILNPRGTDLNVDPAILRLASGGYLAVTMRGAKLYLFTSIDGRTYTACPQPPIEPAQLAPGATGLFDPTLVQLPGGRIFMYATAGSGPGEANSRVVRAEITPSTSPPSGAAAPPGNRRRR